MFVWGLLGTGWDVEMTELREATVFYDQIPNTFLASFKVLSVCQRMFSHYLS